ncbi:MAG: PorT family protein [Muribaculaceae bacterium]|nr:PorT family protein [Muribaculaceae bacterium]
MKTIRLIIIMVVAAVATMASVDANGARLNDKLNNRPYADLRRWHLGFSIGVHTQDVTFTHNGYTTPSGETWFMDQPAFSPGFCVNGLIDFRLNTYFNLRISPGMYFGNRDIKMLDSTTGATAGQNVKSALVVAPVDLKFSSLRLRNVRPYITGGVMPTFDVSKRRSDYLKFNTADCYLTVGFGCDFYLPYFKFIPEVKFCFGLTDILDRNRPDLDDNPDMLKMTQSLKKAASQMVVFSFYFE